MVEKVTLLPTVSHEFRFPLGAVTIVHKRIHVTDLTDNFCGFPHHTTDNITRVDNSRYWPQAYLKSVRQFLPTIISVL